MFNYQTQGQIQIHKIETFPNHAVDNDDVAAYTSIPINSFSKYIIRSGKQL